MNLICGINPVLEALAASTRHFDRLLIVKGLRSRRLSEAIRRATNLGIPLRFEMRDALDRMAGGVPHQGIIAVVSEKPVLSLESLLGSVKEPALLVALDGVEDPRNLGAILRTAEAAGADGVLLPDRHSAGLSETVGRASAGALEHVKVARIGNLVQALEALKARGIWVVGFDAAGTERWDAIDLTRPVALVLGGEGRGIRRLVREHCDHLVSIPHFGHVSSLNVSVAAGIALYEAVRQRRTVPSLVRPIPSRPSAHNHILGPSVDDDETDPGARPYVANDGDGADDDADDAGPSVRHVDLHDDVAWGQGPIVLKPVGFDRGRRNDGRRRQGRRHGPHGDRRGPHGDRRPHPQGEERRAPVPPDAANGAPPPPDGEPHRKGRRRRRGRRREGAPGGGGPPQAAGPTPQNGPPGAGPGDSGAPAAPPAGGGGGRRRRRRRRR
jgi:23S rRNA (guanosine2251-2'-O)-methyltransferase